MSETAYLFKDKVTRFYDRKIIFAYKVSMNELN